jgi:hypothetical protein
MTPLDQLIQITIPRQAVDPAYNSGSPLEVKNLAEDLIGAIVFRMLDEKVFDFRLFEPVYVGVRGCEADVGVVEFLCSHFDQVAWDATAPGVVVQHLTDYDLLRPHRQ